MQQSTIVVTIGGEPTCKEGDPFRLAGEAWHGLRHALQHREAKKTVKTRKGLLELKIRT